MMPLVEKLNRARSNTAESDEALGAIRPKPKHRALPPVKFVLKARAHHTRDARAMAMLALTICCSCTFRTFAARRWNWMRRRRKRQWRSRRCTFQCSWAKYDARFMLLLLLCGL